MRLAAQSASALEVGDGDELIVADNSDAGREPRMFAPGGGAICRSSCRRTASAPPTTPGTPGAAARPASGSCSSTRTACRIAGCSTPTSTPTPGEGVGALAGAVTTDPAQDAFLARYADDRNFLDQDDGLHTAGDAAATANLLVRRAAFDAHRRLRGGDPLRRRRRPLPPPPGDGLVDRAAPGAGRAPPPSRVACRPHGLDRPLRGGRPLAQRALSGDRAALAAGPRPGAVCARHHRSTSPGFASSARRSGESTPSGCSPT